MGAKGRPNHAWMPSLGAGLIRLSQAPGYADPSGTDFAPESSAVCFRFHCRSIDLQYLEETFPLLGFSVRSWMVGWKRSLAKQREEVVTGGDQVS